MRVSGGKERGRVDFVERKQCAISTVIRGVEFVSGR